MLAFILILTETTWSDALSKCDHDQHMVVNLWSSGKGLERERVTQSLFCVCQSFLHVSSVVTCSQKLLTSEQTHADGEFWIVGKKPFSTLECRETELYEAVVTTGKSISPITRFLANGSCPSSIYSAMGFINVICW